MFVFKFHINQIIIPVNYIETTMIITEVGFFSDLSFFTDIYHKNPISHTIFSNSLKGYFKTSNFILDLSKHPLRFRFKNESNLS